MASGAASYGAVETESLLETGAANPERGGKFRRRAFVFVSVATAASLLFVGGSTAPAASLATVSAAPKLRKIFYINCDFSEDRRALQESSLPALGVPYERFSCVAGDTVEQIMSQEFTSQFKDLPRRDSEMGADPISLAHTLGCGFSHWALYDRIASYAETDPDGLYLIIEDDAVLHAGLTVADIERKAATLPEGWAYASLNVHESYCSEDFVNDDWLVKKADPSGHIFAAARVTVARDCTPVTLDFEWGGSKLSPILYLSAAAELLQPKTAKKVMEYLTSRPIFHVDASLRTLDVEKFASYQSSTNLFDVVTAVSEARSGLIKEIRTTKAEDEVVVSSSPSSS